MQRLQGFVRVTVISIALVIYSNAEGACTWSFNWYCSACGKIGGRTTGTQGGYSSESECNSARGSVAREVTTVSCSSSGYCDSPSSRQPQQSSGSRSSPSQQNSFDTGAEEEMQRRQAEEERMRQEAEEAAHRAKEKAEEEQRKREFERNKLDALKTLKGSDFDTSGGSGLKGDGNELPLKTGTDTFGIKTTPDAELHSEKISTSRESRFSKGSQFSAPVDISAKDPSGPITVESDFLQDLIPDGQLGRFINAQQWSAAIKGRVAIAIIDLDRGHPDRAVANLRDVRKAQSKDEFLQRAVVKAEEESKRARIKFSPERFSKELPKEAYYAYVAGWEALEKGDMNGAARLFGRALDTVPGNKTLEQLVSETEKRRRVLTEEEQRQYERRMEKAREYAQGEAALRLGLNAIHWNNALALNYLDEAGRKLDGMEWEFVRLTKQQVADKTHSEPGSYWKYYYKNRGEAMLDALEYGKGDWSAALRYLKHTGQIQKGNAVVDAAYRDLEKLSKETR